MPDSPAAVMEMFQDLGIALGLGLLVGIQRERAAPDIAGFRTFPLVTLLGSVCGLLAGPLGGWVVAGGLLALAAIVVIGNLSKIHAGEPEPGLTTEAALLLMFAVGALVVLGPLAVGIALGGVVAVLLHFKEELHGFARRIGERDFKAVIQFVLLSLVILPVLPNRDFGPYEVLNPREIWLMVVLIVGLSLGGYVGYKLLGHRGGTLLAGGLGGLISSTATTVSFARGSVRQGGGERIAARVILIASAVVFARVLLELAVVAPDFLRVAAGPLATLLLTLAVLSALSWGRGDGERTTLPEQENPTQLKTALVFGALYGLVLLAVAWARDAIGAAGLYGVAALSGLTDMDAITLSTAQLVSDGRLAAGMAWRAILVASLANLAFKAGIIAVLGSRRLLGRMLLWWGIAGAVGVAILLWWPA